jgi:hypothetical protein
MPTLLEVKDKVDNWLSSRWPTVVAREATYASNHGGQYWQGLWTNVNLPSHDDGADDGDEIPDNLVSHPTDQSETWLDLFPELENVPVPAALWIDVYNGPIGRGYIANVALKYLGVIYHRAQNVGPETWHTTGWRVITP